MVVVPGGGWNDRASQGAWIEVERGQLTRVLGELHDVGTSIATVCTGGMVAAAAGLTNGRPGTTHHTALEELRASGAHVIDARVVDEGDLIMAGGVTSGIDLELWLVEREVVVRLLTPWPRRWSIHVTAPSGPAGIREARCRRMTAGRASCGGGAE